VAGYAVFAISYDHQAGLHEFATKHGITYPLLSDEGSAVIRALGVLDQDLTDHHAVFAVPTRDEQQGVAYPMTFVLDGSGRVERKIVEANYRVRQGGSLLLEQLAGAHPDMADMGRIDGASRAEHLAVSAWLDSSTYFAYQRLGLHIKLEIAPGWHLYGPVVPEGYQPVEIAVRSEPSGATLGAIAWPPAAPFHVAGLDEDFAVYEGSIDITIPIEMIIARGSGEVRLEIEIRSQACSATECLPPATAQGALLVPEAPTL